MFTTFGDLASTFQSRQFGAQLKTDMTRLSMELSTGKKSDLGSAVSGDFGPIAGIEHSLKMIEAYESSSAEAATLAETTQIAMDTIQNQNQDLSQGLILASSSVDAKMIRTTAADARQNFQSIVSTLNTNVAGKSLFAGAATDKPALASSEDIMTALMAEISGETSAAGVATKIDEWFDTPGGGFETLGYLGSDDPMGPIRLGNGSTAEMTARADDQAIRDVLKAVAKSAVIAEGALDGNREQQILLTKGASSELLTANDSFTMLRAEIGTVEARIENSKVSMAAEKAALEISRSEIIAADPYETATEFQAVYGQLQSLYTVTARMSQLSFTDYMR